MRELRELARDRPRPRARAAAPRGQGRQARARALRRADAVAEGAALAAPEPPLHARLHRAHLRGLRASCTATAASARTPRSSRASPRFRGRSVVVVGHQKGRGAKENVKRNFGMPHPEGYRKACRIYELASRFGLPIVTLIDTPGAYPGIGAEERGQSEAIGACLAAMARARVPIVADDHRRRRQRRRAGARRRQPRARPRVRHLQRHLARGLRVDPLEGRRARPTRPPRA